MASDFVGATVIVTLTVPPNAQVKGVVQDIQDRVLYLRDVVWVQSGLYMPNFEVQNDILFDLEVISSEPGDFKPSPLVSASSPSIAPVETKLQQAIPFVDPAILSMGKLPQKENQLSYTEDLISLTDHFETLEVGSARPGTSELDSTEPQGLAVDIPLITHSSQVSSPIQRAFQDLMNRKLQLGTNNGLSISTSANEPASSNPSSIIPQAALDETLEKRKFTKPRGRKARPTTHGDLLTVEQSVPRKSRKSTTRKYSTRLSEAQNGWATEEATDIQELGDFDFAANLSKFDKREVFRQLKEDDNVAPSDRLVGHNRLPKPGTNGGRNLHWTENVLDAPVHENETWNSEAGETADDFEKDLDVSKPSIRQKSHSRTRLGASRKSSHNAEDSARRQSQNTIRQASFDMASPRIGSTRKGFASPYLGSNGPVQTSSLHMLETDRPCPTVSPVQMLELEQHAIADLGLNEDILSENAARGIAELAVQLRSARPQSSLAEYHIAIAVGSHKTGARTIAAARHLCNRGFKVTCVVLGREEEYSETIKKQTVSFRKAGGRLLKPTELTVEFDGGLNPGLFIDALTGIHTSFEDFRREDQQWCFELSIWLYQLNTRILSIDVPSGIDPSTGTASTVDGHTLVLHPDTILALGAPKPYLPSFLEASSPSPKAYIADLSLGRNVWKRLSGKRRTGIDFGSKWLVELKLARVDET